MFVTPGLFLQRFLLRNLQDFAEPSAQLSPVRGGQGGAPLLQRPHSLGNDGHCSIVTVPVSPPGVSLGVSLYSVSSFSLFIFFPYLPLLLPPGFRSHFPDTETNILYKVE